MKNLTYRLLRKAGLHAGLFSLCHQYLCRSSAYLKNGVEDVDAVIHRLKQLHPDRGHSSMAINKIIEPYRFDLQVVIPAFNAETYINDCVDSVLACSTHYRVLIVIVNDGSTDGTAQCLKRYEGLDNVKVIHQENQGFSGARNAALKEIVAPYVMFVDSDDRLRPAAIDHLLSQAFRIQSDIVEGGYVRFQEKRTIDTFSHAFSNCADRSELYGYPFGKVIASRLFEHVQFPRGYWFEDTIMIYLIYAQALDVVTIPQLVYDYRVNEQGITFRSRRDVRSIDALWVTRKVLADAAQLRLPFDDYMFDAFLRDICVNFTRFYALRNDAVHRDVFKVECALMQQNFQGMNTSTVKYRPLVQCLIECNYEAYMCYGKLYLL